MDISGLWIRNSCYVKDGEGEVYWVDRFLKKVLIRLDERGKAAI